ncbi:MAG TPA: dihydropyrimidinase [Candidatus Limnocylindrales bacterium]|nr:dihydropyrimidinase [Candidatus Limnocylindrales bacterium]
MTDLLVRGGTVVTAAGTRRADVAVTAGRIEAVGEGLSDGEARSPREVIDADGLLVLPGCVDVHTHTRVASDAEPDRFFRDSVAAAFGGTTTFLAFNNPGTGVSEAGARSLLVGRDEFRARTADDSAVDFGLSAVLSGQQTDPIAELPELIESGVPSFKAFMVYDFRLPDELLFAAMRLAATHRGLVQVHCENATIIDALVVRELAAGNSGPRGHAASRPPYAEAEATHRAAALARAAGASMHVVHLSCADALAEVRAAKAAGVAVSAETCPHYLTLTDERYDDPDPALAIRAVISPPLRSAGDRDALWAGLADGSLDLVATDHVPDRLAVEKRLPAPPFDRISNGGPGIETLLTLLYSEGVARGRLTLERMVELLATTPARRFGLAAKGAVEPGRDADLVLFDPDARRTIRQAELHHTSDFTPYEGIEVMGAVRTVLVRGRPVVRDGRFVGQRGWGRFVERRLD